MNILPKDRIIFPLDVPTMTEAARFVNLLRGHVGMFKIGLELFVSEGPRIIEMVTSTSPESRIFLDLKFHDIPATVRGAINSAHFHGVEFLTVHCDEGRGLLKTVVDNAGWAKILGVTVLTSLSGEDLSDIGIDPRLRDPSELVLHRARIARAAGCHGIVCSGEEVRAVKKEFGNDLTVVTPGIRLSGEILNGDDQKRVVTPYMATYDGADYIVIGRPIRTSKDPVGTATRIAEEIEKALHDRNS